MTSACVGMAFKTEAGMSYLRWLGFQVSGVAYSKVEIADAKNQSGRAACFAAWAVLGGGSSYLGSSLSSARLVVD